MEGKKFILHKVEPKETWQHLSRRYKCSVAELKAANEGVEQLKVGQIINVPAAPSNNVADTPEPKVNHNPAPAKETGGTAIFYTVKKGDTMYSISKRYNKSIEEIKTMNKLSSDAVSLGQVLTVGYTAAEPTKKPEVKPAPQGEIKEGKQNTPGPKMLSEPAETAVTPSRPSVQETKVSPAVNLEKPTKSISPLKKGNTGKTLMQVTETGVATWIQDAQVNPDKYYALHRTAPIGTIVKVTNRMNNQFVYVKVVGALPDTGENENIIIKVSQAVSSKLNALDPLFQVEMSYGMMN